MTLINKVKVFKALKGTLSPTRVGHKVLSVKSIDPETSPLNSFYSDWVHFRSFLVIELLSTFNCFSEFYV